MTPEDKRSRLRAIGGWFWLSFTLPVLLWPYFVNSAEDNSWMMPNLIVLGLNVKFWCDFEARRIKDK